MRNLNYDDDEFGPTPYDQFGFIHKNDLPDLDYVKDFVEGTLEALYETGNVEDLEKCLEEICWQLDVNFPKKNALIKKGI